MVLVNLVKMNQEAKCCYKSSLFVCSLKVNEEVGALVMLVCLVISCL